jgi:plasmid stability protein
MGQILVRKLDDDLKLRLQERARRHGVSMEEEARTILRATLLSDDREEYGVGTKIANLFKDIPDNDEPLERRLNQPMRRINFDE